MSRFLALHAALRRFWLFLPSRSATFSLAGLFPSLYAAIAIPSDVGLAALHSGRVHDRVNVNATQPRQLRKHGDEAGCPSPRHRMAVAFTLPADGAF
jgi:hypothetical protein